ncbi:MAG: hypothetical protein NVSMB27_38340 [Ktedonobacteraceae bacterium]
MESIAQVSALAQRYLVERPKELERSSGFVQRSTARLDGPKFVQMCVLGWMNNASASYSQLNHVVASLGLHVRNQALDERFGPASSQNHQYWITGLKADMLFTDAQGRMWNLTEWLRSLPESEQVVEMWVRAGKQDQVPVRLIARRLPNEVVQRRKQRAKREVERRPRSKGVQHCGRRPKRGPGRQPRQRARKRQQVSARKQHQLEWLVVLINVEGSGCALSTSSH